MKRISYYTTSDSILLLGVSLTNLHIRPPISRFIARASWTSVMFSFSFRVASDIKSKSRAEPTRADWGLSRHQYSTDTKIDR